MQLNRKDIPSGRPAGVRRGAMLAFIGVTIVALLGSMALVLDAGAGHRQRRIAQTAADAGAVGGAAEIIRARYDLVSAAALEEAVRNGFAAADVTVHYPPATGPRAGDADYVEVIIAKTTPTLFASILNRASVDIRARGVAGISSTSQICVQTLDPTGTNALLLNGNIDANCGVAVNSNAASAIYVHPGKDLDAASVSVTGGTTGRGSITPAPSLGAAPSPNPLARIDAYARTIIDTEIAAGCDHVGQVVVSGVMTLNPGVYCGGILIADDGQVGNLTAGNYILAGGGITVRNGGRINGTGITILNTNGPGNDASLYQPYFFGNGCKADISSATTGNLAGILIYQDNAAGLSGTTYVNTFACSNNVPLGGTIYLPTQTAYFGGSNSDSQVNGSVIAYKVETKEGTTLTMNQPINSVSAVKRISLVE